MLRFSALGLAGAAPAAVASSGRLLARAAPAPSLRSAAASPAHASPDPTANAISGTLRKLKCNFRKLKIKEVCSRRVAKRQDARGPGLGTTRDRDAFAGREHCVRGRNGSLPQHRPSIARSEETPRNEGTPEPDAMRAGARQLQWSTRRRPPRAEPSGARGGQGHALNHRARNVYRLTPTFTPCARYSPSCSPCP